MEAKRFAFTSLCIQAMRHVSLLARNNKFRVRRTLVPEVFFRREENIKRQTKKRREKTSGYPRCESHYHATIAVNQHHEIDQQATNNDTPVRFLQSEAGSDLDPSSNLLAR